MTKEEKSKSIEECEDKLAHPENLGTKVETMTRVSGYYRPVSAFNDGKAQELKERQSYNID